MVVDIGKDCMDIIMDYKYGMEHRDRLNNCFKELKEKCNTIDHINFKKLKNWDNIKPQTVILTNQFIIDYYYKNRRGRDCKLTRMFLTKRHFNIQIDIDVGAARHVRELPPRAAFELLELDVAFIAAHHGQHQMAVGTQAEILLELSGDLLGAGEHGREITGLDQTVLLDLEVDFRVFSAAESEDSEVFKVVRYTDRVIKVTTEE